MLFNADHAQTIPFVMPKLASGNYWYRLFDTADEGDDDKPIKKNKYQLTPVSLVVFHSPIPDDIEERDPPTERLAPFTP